MRSFEEAGLLSEVPKAQHNLGYAAFLQGDLVSALKDMEEAGLKLPATSPVLRAIAQQDRAELLMAAGLTREGLAALDEAARTLGQHRLQQRRGEAELTIARAALARDAQRALVAARAARARFDRTRTPALRLKAEALVHGAEVRLGRTRPSLVPRGDDLAAELDALGLRWWAIDIRLDTALVVLRRGDHADATARLRAVRVPAGAPLGVRLRDRDVRAALAERSGRPSAALGHLRRGLGDLHEWQSSFGSLDLQTMVTGHGRRLAVRGLRVASRSRSPEVLFEWSERARMLASRVQPVRVPRDDEVVADLAELRAIAAKEAASREDRAREAELRQRVRERAWRARGSGAYDDPMALGDLQPALGDRALVAHVVTAERVVALVVTGDGRVDPRPRPDRGIGLPARRTASRSRHGGGPPARLVRTDRASRGDQPTRQAGRTAAGAAGRPARRPPARADAVRCPGRRTVEPAADQPRPARRRGRVRHLLGRPHRDAPAVGIGRLRGRPAGASGRERDERRLEGVGRLPGAARRRGVGGGGQPPGRRGGRPARLGARPPLVGEPALLRVRARRRAVVRLRHRPARAACPTSSCCRRARWAARPCVVARS